MRLRNCLQQGRSVFFCSVSVYFFINMCNSISFSLGTEVVHVKEQMYLFRNTGASVFAQSGIDFCGFGAD